MVLPFRHEDSHGESIPHRTVICVPSVLRRVLLEYSSQCLSHRELLAKATAAEIRERCVKPCGKLPSISLF